MVNLDIDPWADAVARYSRAKTKRIAIIAGFSLAAVLAICVAVVLA